MSEQPYFLFDKIVLRTPVFPFNYFLELTSDKKIELERLKNEWKKPLVRESISLSSKSLYNSLLLWEEGKIKDNKKRERLEGTLLKYLIRMSTRCTPFGLLAGFSSIKFGDTTKIVFENSTHFERQVKLDFNYLATLSKKILDSSKEKSNIIWFPNSTIYDNNNSIRYIESNLIDGVTQLTTESVTKNKFLSKILCYSSKGKSYLELKQLLIKEGLTGMDSKEFLNQLIKNQVLVSNLEPNLTGKHYSEVLKDVPEINPEYYKLEKIINPKKKTGNLDKLKLPIKVDLLKKLQSSDLNKQWRQEISKAISFFNKIKSNRKIVRLESFKREFSKRYGTMEMPLGKVLDVEYGINYLNSKNSFENNSFTMGFSPKKNMKSIESSLEWTEITSILNNKVLNAQKLNQKEIRLWKSDFDEIDSAWDNLPTTMFSIIELVTINEKDVLFMDSVGGKTAASITSRFSNNNEEINDLVNEITHLEKVKNKDKILAELIHIPSTKVANVLSRPILREYEIPYLAQSVVPIEKQIPISDLTVTVIDNNIVLKSSKFNKEVMPMLTCAHDYSNSPLAVYQFLCDISQGDKINKIGFDWGSLVSIYRYLPRVIYENIVVSKARWIFRSKDWFNKINKEKNIYSEVKRWQKENDIPPIINLIDNEHHLTINLENQNSVKIFLEEIKNKKWFSIEEILCYQGTPVKDEKDDFYSNEFVISIGQN